jgi:hypothetical protein
MEYAKIVAVTGLPGLFELVSSKSDGAIVKSLDDNSTKFVSSRIHNFSHLESIEVYTVRDNVNLVDIFTAMDQSGEKTPDDKDNAAVKKYFEKVFPELDFDRVYSSDMKKMVKWFGVLKSNNVEIKLREVTEEAPADETAVAEEVTSAKEEKAKAAKATKEETTEEKKEAAAPKKKAATKAKKEEEGEGEGEEKKEGATKKKAAPKAKKEDGEGDAEAPKKKAAPKKEAKK